MNSEMTQGVSRRSFMRILGAASAAATSLPAFAAMQQPAQRKAAVPHGRHGGYARDASAFTRHGDHQLE